MWNKQLCWRPPEKPVDHRAVDRDISNEFCFAACACDRPGPKDLVVYEKNVANVPRFIIRGHVYIRANDTLRFFTFIKI